MMREDVDRWTLTSHDEMKRPSTPFEIFKEFVFFYVDGIAFFGFADFKLKRILGHKKRICDKYSGFKNYLTYFIMFTFMLYIIIS
jgi:hypothetical protein